MKAIVWSKESCTFCEQAKQLLVSNGVEVEERKLGEGWTREQLLEVVPDARSVPQIFLNDQYVGGYPALRTMLHGNFDK